MKLTKNADIDRHKYSGCGIGNNAIIFGVDMSSTVHANNFCTYYLQKRSIELILVRLERNFV